MISVCLPSIHDLHCLVCWIMYQEIRWGMCGIVPFPSFMKAFLCELRVRLGVDDIQLELTYPNTLGPEGVQIIEMFG